MSLLLYLANKGYLIIEKISEKNLLSEAEYKIIEAKEYDGDNIFEQMFERRGGNERQGHSALRPR